MVLWNPYSTPQVKGLLGDGPDPRLRPHWWVDDMDVRRVAPTGLIVQDLRAVASLLPRMRHMAPILGFLVHKIEIH